LARVGSPCFRQGCPLVGVKQPHGSTGGKAVRDPLRTRGPKSRCSAAVETMLRNSRGHHDHAGGLDHLVGGGQQRFRDGDASALAILRFDDADSNRLQTALRDRGQRLPSTVSPCDTRRWPWHVTSLCQGAARILQSGPQGRARGRPAPGRWCGGIG
jgi:hypothetical protein